MAIVEQFIEKAEGMAATVTEVTNYQEVASYVFKLIESKDLKMVRLAAPKVSDELHGLLSSESNEQNTAFIDSDLRRFSDGIDIGVTLSDFGIAETGTIVLNCPEEDLRLATMISDFHVCILQKSKIVENGSEIESELQAFFANSADYTAYITGPSRTADIERVLTIGVHGPLELHILLMEG